MVGAAFILLYGVYAAPSIVTFFDDSLEFQLVLPTFGIAHPTGYPLYTILGGLWSRLLPWGDWAWRVNVFSALCAGATVGLLCAFAQRFVYATQPASAQTEAAGLRGAALRGGIGAALAFGLGPTWWAVATVAEVYALHGLLVALILLLALRVGAVEQAQRARAVTWLALAIGLGLAHHRTTVLLLPAVGLFVVWSDPSLLRPQRAWWGWAGALLAPLLLYAWLPLRYAMGARDLNAAYAPGWTGFMEHVLARRYVAFFDETALAVDRAAGDWAALALRELGWVALALALLGLGAGLYGLLRAGNRAAAPGALRAWALLLAALAGNLVFALLYRVGDVEVFLLPVWLCVAVAAGSGVAWVVRTVRWPAGALAGGVALLLLVPAWGVRGEWVDRRADWAAHDHALALSVPVTGDATGGSLIGLEGEVTALRYMQQALGRAPGIVGVVADDPTLRRARLDELLEGSAPVWLTRELPGIESAYSVSAEGARVRVWPRGQAAPPAPTHALDEPFAGGALRLVGYDLAPLEGSAGRQIRVGLHWLPTQPLTQTLKLSLRVVDGAGEVLTLPSGEPAQADLYPLRLAAPTTAWLPGERVRDEQQIALPANVDGAHLLVILYDEVTLAEAGRVLLPLP